MTDAARAAAAAHVSRPAAEPELLRDARHGLARPQKELPPKYFYDAHGSHLFAAITTLPEYYPTRTERTLLERHAAAIVAGSGARSLVELGAGNADKTRTLLRALAPGARYVPVDISAEFLHEAARQLRGEFPALRIDPVAADMTRLPAGVRPADGPVLFAFLGSTIGNFDEAEAVALLAGIRERMRAGDVLLLGADLVKDPAVLEAAYNDAAGVTAAFNLNVLTVLNRELGADFDLDRFRHLAFFDRDTARIEMHLLSLCGQTVRVPGVGDVRFARGETLRTEISCKYTQASLGRLLAAAGFRIGEWRTDPAGWYGLVSAHPVAAVVEDGTKVAASRRAPASVTAAAAWIRDRLLPRPLEGPRVGAEYELLVQHRDTHAPAQWSGGSGPLAQWLAAHAAAHGWQRGESAKGAPYWRVPGGGRVTLEPGGQVEYATPPHDTPAALVADLRGWHEPLAESAAAHGLELLAVGVDPHNPPGGVPLQFSSARYAQMAEYFAQRSDAGAVMMRQTASLQLNLDVHADVAGTWRLANALAPYLVTLFGNAPAASAAAGVHSARAGIWRTLDPLRTGIFPCVEAPELEYARFAFAAPAMLLDGEPFARGAAAGEYGEAQWEEHLSTLFPEVRLRGYLELRTLDALPLDRAADAIHLLCTLLWDAGARARALAVTGAPDAQLLVRAGEVGGADARLGAGARALWEIARDAGAPLSGATYDARRRLPG